MVKYMFNDLFITSPQIIFHYCLHFILFTSVTYVSIIHRHRLVIVIHFLSLGQYRISRDVCGKEYYLFLKVDSYVFVYHPLFKELKTLLHSL